MAQHMMWDPIAQNYRGQATNGTVVTVDHDVMDMANKKAGKSVYDSDWWIETLAAVLEHWGIYGRRWVDAATKMPRINFSSTQTTENEKSAAPSKENKQLTQPFAPPPQPENVQDDRPSGPLSRRLMSGPLTPPKNNNERK